LFFFFFQGLCSNKIKLIKSYWHKIIIFHILRTCWEVCSYTCNIWTVNWVDMQVRTQFLVNLICATMLKKKRKMVRFKPDQEKELFKHRGSLLLLNRKEFYFCHFLCWFIVQCLVGSFKIFSLYLSKNGYYVKCEFGHSLLKN